MTLQDILGREAAKVKALYQSVQPWTEKYGYLNDPGQPYHGRYGKVENIIVDCKEGLLALFMVYYSDRSGPLNTDIRTRMYRPLSQIELT